MTDRQKVIFLNSAQATNKSLSNGEASFILRNPIQFKNAQVGLNHFSFTNFFINISAALGNNVLYYSDDGTNTTKYSITIPNGSYSLIALDSFLANEQNSAQGKLIFNIVPNYSTNKAGIQYGATAGWFVHFGADSPFTLLGFTNGQNVPASKNATAYYIEYGPTAASFNNITSLKVWTNLTTDSISNTQSSSVIYETSPAVEVGSTQNDAIHNIMWCGCASTSISQIIIRLLDQNEAAVNMTEDFSVALIIKYDD